LFVTFWATAPALGQSAGELLFQSRCGGCHGAGAPGDGPMAGLITVDVPDLTGLAANSNGDFPMAHVVRTIDGRTAGRRCKVAAAHRCRFLARFLVAEVQLCICPMVALSRPVAMC